MNKLVASTFLSLALVGGTVGVAVAQSADTSTTTQIQADTSDKGVGHDLKQAGKSTGRAAKKGARKTKRVTKKIVHKGAKKSRQGAEKVEDKTEATPQQ